MNHSFRLVPSVCVVPVVAALFSTLLASAALANNPIPQVVGPPVPQAVVPGSAEFTLKVYGANFVEGAVVNWNRQPRTTTFVSARELDAQILASDVAKPTAGYITVTNPPPGDGVSSSSYSIVEVHTPTTTLVPGANDHYGTRQEGTLWAMVTADFNNDGILDLAWGGGANNVFVQLGNRDGRFPSGSHVSRSYSFSNLVFGDFSGTGNLDLGFTAGINPPYHYQISLGDGNGKFRRGAHFGSFAGVCVCVAADLNGDGYLDLLVLVDGTNYVYLGNGDGTFRRIKSHSDFTGFAAAAGDFNGDGKLDLVVEALANGGHSEELYFVAGNGDGTFQKPRSIIGISQSCGTGMLASDFNGDGKLDLAFCDLSLPALGVLSGNGDGTFKKPVYYPLYASGFAAGDFNSDGNTDILVNAGSGYTWVLLGNGNGTFKHAQKINIPDSGLQGIVLGDFNSDGLLDFVFLEDGWGFNVHLQK